jgi:hypothetical protein
MVSKIKDEAGQQASKAKQDRAKRQERMTNGACHDYQGPCASRPGTGSDRGHGREEHRTLQAPLSPPGSPFPHAAQATRVTHQIRPFSSTSKWRTDLTGLRAAPCRLAPDWLHTVAPLAPVRITNVVLLWIRVKARSV